MKDGKDITCNQDLITSGTTKSPRMSLRAVKDTATNQHVPEMLANSGGTHWHKRLWENQLVLPKEQGIKQSISHHKDLLGYYSNFHSASHQIRISP